jgi:hypothetical protein
MKGDVGPTFICIGPGRSGTSWLYEVLLGHPEVCMSKVKEVEFFNTNWHKGLHWYFRHFRHCRGALAVGEISNMYYLDPDAPSRIKSALPGVKLIACLRNPYDWIVSTYLFDLRQGTRWRSLEEAVRSDPFFLQSSHFYTHLSRFAELFGDNMYFMLYDRLRQEPQELLREVYHFIGVNPAFRPPAAKRVVNRAIVPRHRWAGKAAKGAASIMRKTRAYGLLTLLKRSEAVKGIFFEPWRGSRDSLITREVRELLDPALVPEIEKLSSFTQGGTEQWLPRAKGGAPQ